MKAPIGQKLMVYGFVCPASSCALSIEVKRGMLIYSKEGKQVGQVAAVILDSDTQKATHILLSRLPDMNGYWMVPAELISEVRDGTVWLGISQDDVDTFPLWQSRE